jgi:tyrosine-protein phosphatase SIW14
MQTRCRLMIRRRLRFLRPPLPHRLHKLRQHMIKDILKFTAGAVIALSAAWLVAGCKSVPMLPAVNGVPNLMVVDPGFYRSGQPDAAGFKWLEEHDLVTVVLKLNTAGEGSDDLPDGTYQAPFYKVIRFPITFEQQMGLEPIDMDALKAIILSLPHYGTLIHCSHGQDRTGLAVAMHRVLVDGWSKPAAEQEMLANGFHKELAGLWYAWQKF